MSPARVTPVLCATMAARASPGRLWVVAVLWALSAPTICSTSRAAGPRRDDTPRVKARPSKSGRISVSGRDFVDSSGRVARFEGVHLGDHWAGGVNINWTEAYFREAASWGANVVRLQISPGNWRSADRGAYLKRLDQGVSWAAAKDMYVILCWHGIGDPVRGFHSPAHPYFGADLAASKAFWATVSERYKADPVVAFYEIFNEPHEGFGSPRLTWPEWKAAAEEIIDVIRARNPHAIAMVGGLHYALDLRGAASDPVERSGIAYTGHFFPYSASGRRAFDPEGFTDRFGFLAKTHPVFVTEFGYSAEPASAYRSTAKDYGEPIVDHMRRQVISWVAALFVPGWDPALISDWDFTPTDFGRQIKSALADQPKGRQ